MTAGKIRRSDHLKESSSSCPLLGPFRRTRLRFEFARARLETHQILPSTQISMAFESGRRNDHAAGCRVLHSSPQAQAAAKASCIASSARSKSPSKRIRVPDRPDHAIKGVEQFAYLPMERSDMTTTLAKPTTRINWQTRSTQSAQVAL